MAFKWKREEETATTEDGSTHSTKGSEAEVGAMPFVILGAIVLAALGWGLGWGPNGFFTSKAPIQLVDHKEIKDKSPTHLVTAGTPPAQLQPTAPPQTVVQPQPQSVVQPPPVVQPQVVPPPVVQPQPAVRPLTSSQFELLPNRSATLYTNLDGSEPTETTIKVRNSSGVLVHDWNNCALYKRDPERACTTRVPIERTGVYAIEAQEKRSSPRNTGNDKKTFSGPLSSNYAPEDNRLIYTFANGAKLTIEWR